MQNKKWNHKDCDNRWQELSRNEIRFWNGKKSKDQVKVAVIDKDSQVEKLLRSIRFKGFSVDVVPYRFCTKNNVIIGL